MPDTLGAGLGLSVRTGIIKKKTDKGFGFVSIDGDERDVFFHSKALADMSSDELREGDAVEVFLGETSKGPIAAAVLPQGASRERIDEVRRRLAQEQADQRHRQQTFDEESAALDPPTRSIIEAVREFSEQVALAIARDPGCLLDAEWRDLERVVAYVFEALGFTVTLTDGSKDGGKDVILEWHANGQHRCYIAEIKRWRSKRVGEDVVQHFLEVVVKERRDGGLLLSVSGYTTTAFSQLSVVERHVVRFGDRNKIVGLCQTFSRFRQGLWLAPLDLSELIYAGTV